MAISRKALEKLWAVTGGRAWEPPEPQHPKVLELLAAGYVRRVDGRCGFERFKDGMLSWTPAGRAALERKGG